ncbi:MAG: hypothetical protein A2Y23_00490 [Clostridiales bacterium GWB2_37_7]|nr:MAG: hypothetical protein A2Y23_00490 [Clostridiales bacterium GWB2_37_7]
MKYRNAIIIILVILLSFTVIFFVEYLQLINISLDGDGIGISILGMEINDHVNNEDIDSYKILFMILAIISLIGSTSLGYMLRATKNFNRV